MNNYRNEDRHTMMLKRHAFIAESLYGFTTLEEYAKQKKEWYAIFGVKLELRKDCVSLHFELGNREYEEYYVGVSAECRLDVSNIIFWQNEVCANELLNIFTGQTYDNEDMIRKSLRG